MEGSKAPLLATPRIPQVIQLWAPLLLGPMISYPMLALVQAAQSNKLACIPKPFSGTPATPLAPRKPTGTAPSLRSTLAQLLQSKRSQAAQGCKQAVVWEASLHSDACTHLISCRRANGLERP
eukprot:1157514-Pelagomonas_calceolata.AAC.6